MRRFEKVSHPEGEGRLGSWEAAPSLKRRERRPTFVLSEGSAVGQLSQVRGDGLSGEEAAVLADRQADGQVDRQVNGQVDGQVDAAGRVQLSLGPAAGRVQASGSRGVGRGHRYRCASSCHI